MNFCEYFKFGAVRRCVNLVDLEKCEKISIWLQKSASIPKRTSPLKFDHFRYPKPDFTASNLSTEAHLHELVVERGLVDPLLQAPVLEDLRLVRQVQLRDLPPAVEALRDSGSLNSRVEFIETSHLLIAQARRNFEGSFSGVSKPNFAIKYTVLILQHISRSTVALIGRKKVHARHIHICRNPLKT